MGEVEASRRKALSRAEEIATRHGVKPTSASEWIISTFLSSSRTKILPYHVESWDEEVLSFAEEKGIKLFAEAKYDGTHVQLADNGVFGHAGGAVTSDQLAGLIYVAETQPQLMEVLRRYAERGYVMEAELFGSSQTPWGFHRGHRYHFDLVVFEVGRDGRWIPPQERYSMKDLPQPAHWEVEPDPQALLELSRREDVYEGVVVKGEYKPEYGKFREYLSFIKSDSLLVFKVKGKEVMGKRRKKSEPTKPRVQVDPKVEEAIEGEVLNELAKRSQIDQENFREVLYQVVNYLKEAHPLLVERAGGEREVMRITGRVMGREMRKGRK